MTKIYNRIKKYLFTNDNKILEQELEQEQFEQKKEYIIKQPSNAVIEIANRFKNSYENNQNLCQNDSVCSNVQVENDNLYIQFEKFVLEKSEGEKRPSNKDIESHLKIDSIRKRRELIDYGVKKGFLIRKNDTTTIFNINYTGGVI